MLLLIDLLVIALVVVLVLLVAQVREYHFDYGDVALDTLRARREAAMRRSAVRRMLQPFVAAFAGLVSRLGLLESHRARIRQLLLHAGNPWGQTAEEFVGWGLALAAVAYAGLLAAMFLMTGGTEPVWALIPAAAVYVLTVRGLRAAAARRRVLIDRQMPFFLDLLCMSMDAGSTLAQACRQMTAAASHGPFEEEIDVMLHEIDAGVPMPDALRNITRRTDSEEVALLVQAVRQGHQLGTPMTRILRDQASLSRYRRTKRAEQLAAKLPNRMAVPTVVLMMAVLLLLFGPIIVKATRGGLTG
jgi:tight adherence protein C